MAGRIQQILASLFIIGSVAAIVLIFALGSINIEGYSAFRAPDLVEYMTSPFALGMAALACVFAANFYWARSWLKGNLRAKTPLVGFAIVQTLFFPYLTPVGIYCLWALLRKLPAE